MKKNILLYITLLAAFSNAHAGKHERAIQPYSRNRTMLAAALGALHIFGNAVAAEPADPCLTVANDMLICPPEDFYGRTTAHPLHFCTGITQHEPLDSWYMHCRSCTNHDTVLFCNNPKYDCKLATLCSSEKNIFILNHCNPQNAPKVWVDNNTGELMVQQLNGKTLTWADCITKKVLTWREKLLLYVHRMGMPTPQDFSQEDHLAINPHPFSTTKATLGGFEEPDKEL